jgi:hypothetical protein
MRVPPPAGPSAVEWTHDEHPRAALGVVTDDRVLALPARERLSKSM